MLLAALAATSPTLWLLDEPFSALDASSRAHVQQWLRGLAAGGATVVIACDEADTMARLADRLVVLQRGAVALDGAPSTLLASDAILATGAATTEAATLAATAMIEQLHPNRDQPRRHFDDDALQELADSIAAHGVLEPILVRKRAAGGYEIIAGERRWRAAQRAGVMELPIHVRELSDAVAFEAALVENIQREDLNPLETARAFQRLIDEFGHSQQDVADRVGKNRVTVTNALRLLKLPEEVLITAPASAAKIKPRTPSGIRWRTSKG